ncbi:hypothetical protein BG011_008024 [Mortierella polycephala]|uniref:Galactose oxidase n=1 Tax=Mortierella polycephala TaxID=41804 RepID=A0A9P6QEK5_9FUNG|nr:hypothetical protein BG011_008024 [Mortierella polycephala]
MAYTYAPKLQRLYVQGGTTSTNSLSTQFFALDFSQSWPTDNPVWINLAPDNLPSLNFSGLSGAVIDDDQFLVNAEVLDTDDHKLYRYKDSQWSSVSSSLDMLTAGPLMVVDPKAHSVYFLEDSARIDRLEDPIPVTKLDFLKTDNGQAGSWSTMLSGVVSTSITDSGTNGLGVRKYLPESNGQSWEDIRSARITPISARTGHCFTPNSDGSEFYMFGGIIDSTKIVTGELHVLNPTTGTWIDKATSEVARANMACAVVGNTFVVWGGVDENNSVADGTPLLFDMTSGNWITNFEIPTTGFNPSPTISLPNAPPSSASGSSNKAAIIGGAVGGVTLVALVAALLVIKRRGRKRDTREMNTSHGNGSKSGKSMEGMNENGTGEQGGYKTIPSPFTTPEDGYNHDSVSHAKGSLALETTIPLAVRQPPFENAPAHQERYPYPQLQRPGQAPFIAPPFDIENDTNVQSPLLNQPLAHPSGPPPPLAPRPLSVLHTLPAGQLGQYGYSQQQPTINFEDDDDDHLSTVLSRSMEHATVDLIPITASEAGDGSSVHSRSNSIVSNQSVPASQVARMKSRATTSNNKTRLLDEDEDDNEPLNYLDIS